MLHFLNNKEIDQALIASAPEQGYPGVLYSAANLEYLFSRQMVDELKHTPCSIVTSNGALSLIGTLDGDNCHSYVGRIPSLLIKNSGSANEQLIDGLYEIFSSGLAKNWKLRMNHDLLSNFFEAAKKSKKVSINDFSVHATNIVSLDSGYLYESRFRSGLKIRIKNSEKLMIVRSYIGKSLETEIFSEFRKLYESESGGRAKISDQSWQILQKHIIDGNSMLSCGYVGLELVGAALINILGTNAYYSMGVSKRDKHPLSISHLILRDAMRELLKINVNSIEVGEVWSSKSRTMKIKGIEEFKASFKGKQIFTHNFEIAINS